MLLGLLRSLRPLRCSEPLLFRTSLKINNIVARITLPRYFDFFLINSWNFIEILPSLRTEAVEDRDVTFDQIQGS